MNAPTRDPGPAGRYDGKLFGPPAEIEDDTQANKPHALADGEPCTRAARARPESWNPEALTFEAVAATPTPVQRRDARGPYLEVLTASTLVDNPQRDLPVFDAHRGGSARATIGVVQTLRREGETVVAVLRLSQAEDVAPIMQRVADGTVRHVSVGYQVTGWREITDDEGRRIKTPTGWAITEISLVPNPADPNARIRGNTEAPAESARAGSRADRPFDNRAAGVNAMSEQDTTTAPPEDGERTRRQEIRTLVRAAGLPSEFGDDLIDTGADVTAAKAAIFDKVQTRSVPVIRATAPANDDPATIRTRQADALAYRMAGGELHEASRPYAEMSLMDMARDSLERTGTSTRGMSRDEILHRAAHGTSDFPLVVSNAAGKTAMQAYQAAESPLKALCRRQILRDFKASTAIRVGEMGELVELAESGEFTHTSRAETGEPMSLKTYGRAINVSRNLIVNDDLNLLGDMVSAFGEAAAQTEASHLVALLTDNPNMADGTAVFDASRGNVGTLDVAGWVTALSEARAAMRLRTGLDGTTIIDAKPAYVLVPAELESVAEEALAVIQPTKVGDVNPFAGKLRLLVEPRLPADHFYLFTDPARLPAMRYGYLAGAEGVQIQRREAWDTLGLSFRAYLDFGCGWLDWRGAHRMADGT